jgi:hypothetical protein
VRRLVAAFLLVTSVESGDESPIFLLVTCVESGDKSQLFLLVTSVESGDESPIFLLVTCVESGDKSPHSKKTAMIQGLVSTIIPVYNRAGMLREAVASVLAQTYRPIEIIIVDDGSTDDTARVADELAQANPQEVSVIHQPNTGPGLAREAGRRAARGEFIQYLDSDDVLLPQKFKLQVAGLDGEPECCVSYGKTRFGRVGEQPSEAPWKRTGERIATLFPSMLESRWWGTSTPLYRRLVTDKAGPWTNLLNEEDWEYDCRIATQGVCLNYVNEFVSYEREHYGHRLSRGGTSDERKLEQRAAAHALILKHAQRAGLTEAALEMQHFARELFLVSRQCGAAGLAGHSKELFELAREASGKARGNGWDFKLYGFFASVVGWTSLGKVACYSDGVRNERSLRIITWIAGFRESLLGDRFSENTDDQSTRNRQK